MLRFHQFENDLEVENDDDADGDDEEEDGGELEHEEHVLHVLRRN